MKAQVGCPLLPKRLRPDGAYMSYSTRAHKNKTGVDVWGLSGCVSNSGGFTICVGALVGCPLLPKRLRLDGPHMSSHTKRKIFLKSVPFGILLLEMCPLR